MPRNFRNNKVFIVILKLVFTNIQSSKKVNTQIPQACEKVEQQEKNFQSETKKVCEKVKFLIS